MQQVQRLNTGTHERRHEPERYEFGEFELDLGAWELRSGGRALAVRSKTMAVLAYLVRHRDRLVSRDELMTELWPDVHVSAGSISQAIWEIREALRDGGNGSPMITTAYARGYRFVARVDCARDHERVLSA